MSKELAQTVGGKKFTFFLILVMTAVIAVAWMQRDAKAASATEESMYAGTANVFSFDVVANDHPPQVASSEVSIGILTTSIDTLSIGALPLTRVYPYAIVGSPSTSATQTSAIDNALGQKAALPAADMTTIKSGQLPG